MCLRRDNSHFDGEENGRNVRPRQEEPETEVDQGGIDDVRISELDDVSEDIWDENSEESEDDEYDSDEDLAILEAEKIPIRKEETSFERDGKLYTICLTLKNPTDEDLKEDDVKVVNATINHTKVHGKDVVGYLGGVLLSRPKRNFFEITDSISNDVYELSRIFCDSEGVANRIETGLVNQDIYRGGYFHIQTLELQSSHRGYDLGLRLVHETLLFLKQDWNLAVVAPGFLTTSRPPGESGSMYLAARGLLEAERTTAQLEQLQESIVHLQRHFARMGFRQAGKNASQYHAWYLTSKSYFRDVHSNPADAINYWKSKDEIKCLPIYVPPVPADPLGLNKELEKLVYKGCLSGNSPDVSEKIEDLILRGASIQNARALHAAAASSKENTKILLTLIRLGADVNALDVFGDRPLHLAAAAMNAAAVACLISAGADSSLTNEAGDSAMDALRKEFNSIEEISFCINLIAPSFSSRKLETLVALSPETRHLLIDGWLSPRMWKLLERVTEVESSCIATSVEFLFEDHVDNRISLKECCARFGLPNNGLEGNGVGFSKEFFNGWGVAFAAIKRVIQRKKSPTLSRVCAELQSMPRKEMENWNHFQAHGGKVEYALESVLNASRILFYYEYHHPSLLSLKDDIEAYPSTVLDGVFDVVRYKVFET